MAAWKKWQIKPRGGGGRGFTSGAWAIYAEAMDDIKVQNVENQTISGSMCVQPLRLLIVGAGLTGAMTTALIKHNFPTEVKIDVWEKSLGAGGRMKTHRAPDGKSSVDLGAQYVTRTSQYAKKHER